MRTHWRLRGGIASAVSRLARQADVPAGRVAGIGFSVGDETMLEAAARTPLRAVVSESAGIRSRIAPRPVFPIYAAHGTGGDPVGHERGVVFESLDRPLLGKE